MKKTLLVLGAGATKDVFWFFPTGFELIKEINYHLITELIHPYDPSKGPFLSSLMNELIRALTDTNGQFIQKEIPLTAIDKAEVHDFIELTQILKTKLWEKVLEYEYHSPRGKKFATDFISIDNFLFKYFEHNEPIKQIAKYAISYLLIGCEKALKYKIDECYEDWIDDNWINTLFEKLKNYSLDEIVDNLKVVTFNYDRTFEFFFERYLTKHFGALSNDLLDNFFEKNIKHIYGELGNIKSFPFGAFDNDKTKEMISVYQNFDLMYFDRKELEWPPHEYFDQILFIGFGYDKDNISKLCLNNVKSSIMNGTGYGLSPDKIAELIIVPGIKIDSNLTCAKFISQVF